MSLGGTATGCSSAEEKALPSAPGKSTEQFGRDGVRLSHM